MPVLQLRPKNRWLVLVSLIFCIHLHAQTPCVLTDTTFREVLSLANDDVIVRDQVSDANGTVVLMGDNSASSIRVALINLKGQIEWDSRFSFDEKTAVTFIGNNIIPAKDGYFISFLAYDNESDYSVFIGKIAKNGRGLWFRKLSVNRTLIDDAEFLTTNLTLTSITALPDGGVLFALSEQAGTYINGDSYVNILATAQLDATGNLLWNTSFLNDGELPFVGGIYPDSRPNSFAVLSTFFGYGSGRQGGFLNIRFNPYEKNVFNVKSYIGNLPISITDFSFFWGAGARAHKFKSDNFIAFYRSQGPAVNSTLWTTFDTSLTYKNAFTVSNEAFGYLGHGADRRITEDGHILYHSRYGSNSNDSLYSNIALLNNAGKKIKEYKIRNSHNTQTWRFGFTGNSYDSIIGASTAIENGKYKLEYFNIGGGGNLNNEYCATFPSNDIKTAPRQLTEYSFKIDLVRYDLWQSTMLAFTETAETFDREIQCSKVITCDSIKLEGPLQTCGFKPLTYTIHRTTGCTKPLQWLVDTSQAIIVTYPTDSSIVVLPKVNGTIPIIAKFLECDNIRDAIQLVVTASQEFINLGNDTTICAGTKLTLDAGVGFINYKWQDGVNTQSITVSQAGKYWVQAVGACGQLLSDTIVVLQDTISVKIPAFAALCKGDSIAITPSTTGSVSSVIWQPVIGINSPRDLNAVIRAVNNIQYIVNVFSESRCSAADTIQVTVWPSPLQFLLPDYSVCLGDSIIIKPLKKYAKYQWINGTTGNSFTTNALGNYWLTVTDTNICSGTEFFTIKELDCTNTIYFPSAFSPNGDRLNDSFKPLITGNLTSIHLKVYNRWGQVMFESNSADGWNGSVKGKLQPAGAYIWQCSYQFVGRERKSLSGNVALLR